MQQLISITELQTISTQFQSLIEKVSSSNEHIQQYLKFINSETLYSQLNSSQSLDDQIKLRESILDKFLNIDERKKNISEEQKQIINVVEELKKAIHSFTEIQNKDSNTLDNSKNNLINELIQMKQLK